MCGGGGVSKDWFALRHPVLVKEVEQGKVGDVSASKHGTLHLVLRLSMYRV